MRRRPATTRSSCSSATTMDGGWCLFSSTWSRRLFEADDSHQFEEGLLAQMPAVFRHHILQIAAAAHERNPVVDGAAEAPPFDREPSALLIAQDEPHHRH